MRIAVAMSGGTDSLYALLALRGQGHEVSALHARFLSPGPADPVPGLAALCERLDVPLAVVDLRADFERNVIEAFADEHRRARTPNPCAVCNRTMKFGLLLDAALAPDGPCRADALATGHYVALEPHPVYGPALRAGADSGKDQSYFLALTPVERLRRCVFPLAGERKTGIREWLRLRGFEPPLPRESQEICFVPDDDHRAFLLARAAAPGASPLPGPGPVALDDGTGPGRVLGEHRGLWQYTEGQRKGLGIAWSEPLFVLRRDRKSNTLVVGPRSRQETIACAADQVNVLAPPKLWPERLRVRIRYRHAPVEAAVRLEDGVLRIRFAEPQQPPAPGQVAAVYDADGFVLAGGVLTSA